jgi:predicted anti-sigma-YlaC factor YlaD
MCEDVRVAMSARLDAEDPGLDPEQIDGHLTECADCAAWLAAAQRLAPTLPPAPDLTGRIMAAVDADPVIAAAQARRRATAEAQSRQRILRVAVAAAATVQLALAVPTLVGTFLASELGPHTSREMASFDMAVAIGFLFVAYRPARARALVPVAIALAILLGVTSVVDIVRGVAGTAHEIGHLVAVVQAGLLWSLSRLDTGRAPRVPRARVAGTQR